MDVSVHLNRLCESYRQHRRGLLPVWFRENHLQAVGNCMGYSAHTLVSLAKTCADIVPRVFDNMRHSVTIFAIGSLGRIEATPESDIDLVVVLDDQLALNVADGKERVLEFYRLLVKTRVDLRFEHAEGIRNGTFDLSDSKQYPVLSITSLINDPANAGRRLQLLFEAKVLYNYDMAEQIWKKIVTLYSKAPHQKSAVLLRGEFIAFFRGFWQNFLKSIPQHVSNSQIIKLLIHRELALFSSSLILAYAYNVNIMRDDSWQEILRETNAPLANKLLRWCELPTYFPHNYAYSTSRKELEELVEKLVSNLSENNRRLYNEWFKSQELRPLPFYTISLSLIVLAQLLLADYNNFLEQVTEEKFREWIDQQPTDILTWYSSPEFAGILNTRESIVETMGVFSSVALALMNWRVYQKTPVPQQSIEYLKITQNERIFPPQFIIRRM